VGDEAAFDPFRFSDFVPVDFLREAELKHCRICMLAYVGFIAVDIGFKIYPFPEAYEQGGMGQILLWMSLAEIISSFAVIQMLQGSGREPGYFGFDPLNFLKGKSEEEVNTMKMKELTNGRLAMLAFSGIVTQAVLTQGPFPYV
jgi:Chlorophyll A-B binding protein